jgi:tRNA(fMet)-specific endonuclease VapC
MGLKYLLDTNILSEPVKKIPDQNVLKALDKYAGEYCTCVTVWHELVYGIELLERSKKKDLLSAYLESLVRGGLTVLSYEKISANWFSKERARLSKIGIISPISDGEIAAISAVNALTLVTRNGSDFENFNGLMIENWFTPTP